MAIGIAIGFSQLSATIASFIVAFKTRVLADGGTFEGETNLLNQSLVAINSAGFVYVPSAFKSGRLYSLKPSNGSGDLIFSRNSLAYRNNVSNVLEQMAANVGRINYVNGVPTLLMEPARTNLCLQSETINIWAASSANFTKTNTTVLGLNASKLVCNTTSNGADYQAGLRYSSMPCSLLASTTYTMSFFVEKTSANSVFSMYFFTNPSGFDGQYIATFNATSLTTTMPDYGAAYTNKSAKITHVSGNVFFCETTFTTPASNSSVIYITFGFGPSGVNTQIAGNEGSFTGLQIEKGAFSTSRILTTTASVTRVGDSLSLNNLYTNNLVGINGGTWIIKLVNNIAMPRVSGYPTIFIGSNTAGSAGNIIGLYSQSSAGRLALYYIQNGAFTAIGNTLSDTLNVAFVWTPTSLKAFINGVLINTYLGLTWDITTFQNFITYSEITINMQYMSFANYPMSDTEVISRMS